MIIQIIQLTINKTHRIIDFDGSIALNDFHKVQLPITCTRYLDF
jgi:hypothetical protein